MNDQFDPDSKAGRHKERGFLASILVSLARDAAKLIIAFAIGTGGGAIVCWYYGIPLVFSVLGGILVLGIVVMFMSDSVF